MDDNKLYNILIIASIIAIISILIFTTKTTDSFTELYFEDHQDLPDKIQLNKEYLTKFSIHNLENEDTVYNYKTSIEHYKSDKLISTITILEDSITLNHDQSATISFRFTIEESFDSAKIIVETNNQDIHFWVEEAE